MTRAEETATQPLLAPKTATQPLLAPKTPHTRGTPTDVSPLLKLKATLQFFPVINMLADVALFVVLIEAKWYLWAVAVLAVMLLFLRFMSLYSALRPAPELTNFLLMCAPHD